MSRCGRVVRFAIPSGGAKPQQADLQLAPERGLATSRLSIWVVLTIILWTMIALPALIA